jgi:membrane-bound lytic murein transglycosylase A
MSSNSASAASISRFTTDILGVILLAAGCAQVPPPCPCPPPKPAAEARYEPVEFAALPGWEGAPLAASVRALVTSCARVAPGDALHGACTAARALAAGDEAAARAFYETAFSAYAVVAPDGAREGLVTGY